MIPNVEIATAVGERQTVPLQIAKQATNDEMSAAVRRPIAF
jgi:hypothetical protein